MTHTLASGTCNQPSTEPATLRSPLVLPYCSLIRRFRFVSAWFASYRLHHRLSTALYVSEFLRLLPASPHCLLAAGRARRSSVQRCVQHGSNFTYHLAKCQLPFIVSIAYQRWAGSLGHCPSVSACSVRWEAILWWILYGCTVSCMVSVAYL